MIDNQIFDSLNKMIKTYYEACILWRSDKFDQIIPDNEEFKKQQLLEGQELDKHIKYHGRNSTLREAYLLKNREIKEIGGRYIYI